MEKEERKTCRRTRRVDTDEGQDEGGKGEGKQGRKDRKGEEKG